MSVCAGRKCGYEAIDAQDRWSRCDVVGALANVTVLVASVAGVVWSAKECMGDECGALPTGVACAAMVAGTVSCILAATHVISVCGLCW